MSRPSLDPIQQEQVKQLYEAQPSALFASLVNAAIVIAMLSGQVPAYQLMAWAIACAVMLLGRYAVMRAYRRQPPHPAASAIWQTRFYVGVAVAGLIWGGTALAIFPAASPAHQILLTLVIAGTSAGAVSTLSYQWQTISFFLVLTLLPFVLRFAYQGDSLSHSVAVLAAFFLVMMLLTSRRIYRSYYANLILREEAQASETRFRNLLQATPDALFIVDDEGRIEFINQRAVGLFGYSEEDLRGQPVDTLVPVDHRERHAQHREKITQEPSMQPMQANRNVFARRKDGSEFPADVTLSRIAFANGTRTCAAVRDVTDRWESEQTLRKAKMAAEAANQAKSSFLSAMSHELRTPLNAILGFSQLMRDDPDLSHEQRENIGEIHLSGEHLLKLINDVLDLSRIEAGRMQLSIEPVGVGDLAEACMSMTEPMARHHGIALRSRIEPCSKALVRADRTRLLQTLLNLVSNAIKYNREHGSVELACEHKPDNKLRVSVTDTGLGISPEKQRELFLPFSRLGKEFSNIEGTGIGLSLSKQIIEIMEGELGFSSELGKGTTFWIDLPYLGELDDPANSQNLAASQAKQSGQITLLYIEDNPINQQLVGRIFAALPAYRLLQTTAPSAGLQIAHEARPDLILLDIDMPDMSGLEVATQLKLDAATQSIPIIAVTAENPDDVAALRDRSLFAGYVAKPINRRWLLDAIDKMINRTASRTLP